MNYYAIVGLNNKFLGRIYKGRKLTLIFESLEEAVGHAERFNLLYEEIYELDMDVFIQDCINSDHDIAIFKDGTFYIIDTRDVL